MGAAEVQEINRMLGAMKSNPLVGYERPPNITVRDVNRESVPLISPHAERRFGEILAKVPFNLHVVVIHDVSMDAYSRAIEWVGVHNLNKKGVETRTFYAAVLVETEREIPRSPEPAKWDVLRMSPITPFMVLHRLFEVYGDHMEAVSDEWGDWVSSTWDDLGGQTVYGPRYRTGIAGLVAKDFVSAGVDTAAGRNIALGSTGDMLADLWAKWCITGRIAFDPRAYPARWNDAPRSAKDEAAVSAWIARRVAVAPSIEIEFKRAAAYLARGGAYLL